MYISENILTVLRQTWKKSVNISFKGNGKEKNMILPQMILPHMWEGENLFFTVKKLPETIPWCIFQNDALMHHCSNSQAIACCRTRRTSVVQMLLAAGFH